MIRVNFSLGVDNPIVGPGTSSADTLAKFATPLDQSLASEEHVSSTVEFDSFFNSSHQGSINASMKTAISRQVESLPKFFILAPPQVSTSLLDTNSSFPYKFYERTLNEECAELWLYRGTKRLSYEEGQTQNTSEADFFLLPGLLHLYSSWESKKNGGQQLNHSFVGQYKNIIVSPTKPHLILVPTWNPKVSRIIGLKSLVEQLQDMGVNLWSVGFERNHLWQHTPSNRIVPIPYVVRPSRLNDETSGGPRTTNFVFYAGDKRPNAKEWAGCHRDKLIEPLRNETNMYVRIVNKRNRLNQTEYNRLMSTSEYCLILCGDTPSSRSLTSAIVSGCIPIRVGTRLRGLCEPPCKKGFGWKPTGLDNPHLPYPAAMDWDRFPEVNEAEFMKSGKILLQTLFQQYDGEAKAKLRAVMQTNRNGWIYGWGNPVDSEDFGGAIQSILSSFQDALKANAG
jgi:Exostosin family